MGQKPMWSQHPYRRMAARVYHNRRHKPGERWVCEWIEGPRTGADYYRTPAEAYQRAAQVLAD